MTKCIDCKIRYKPYKKIHEECPCGYEFCTWICAECGEKFSIEKTPMYARDVKVNKDYTRTEWICGGCKDDS